MWNSMSNEEDNKSLAAFGLFVGSILLVIASVLWGGFLLKTLWNWFVADTLGVTMLNLPQAAGLMVFISATKGTRETKEGESTLSIFIQSFILGIILLVIGWIVVQFI